VKEEKNNRKIKEQKKYEARAHFSLHKYGASHFMRIDLLCGADLDLRGGSAKCCEI
jgi:hypothetical protein